MSQFEHHKSSKIMRPIWLFGGLIAFVLGAVGVVLPFLPTTPFILLAAFCFARSSQRCHQWLVGHRIFGPLILNWRQHGAIGRPTKIIAVISMGAIFTLSILLGAPRFALIAQAIILLLAGTFVLSRPLPPPLIKDESSCT
ncbi:YbaN family protein [Robiginitomaculum antarcticum]|uniref:YbaN family protein n=1 Tax=Robiginitomaculum antarcticum TaxID=437507 RepID=UPI0003607A80|nr:YbaN family protein [Robiginitomaculum antarcticum]